MGKFEGKKLLRQSRIGGGNNIKIKFKNWDGCLDLIPLTQDSDKWRALVNTLMNPRVP